MSDNSPMSSRRLVILCALAALAFAQESKRNRTSPVGYSDTPVLPGQKWKVHDIDRPHPPVVTPGSEPGKPPSDAIVLFDGTDLSKWQVNGHGENRGKVLPASWKVADGYMEVIGGSGSIYTKEKFGDVQLHVEWASPADADGSSQWRGNSGILLMSRYEIQVLDSYNNKTYADGQAGALYGQWPPLVNASRKPGEWQTYDILWEAPHFAKGKLAKPAYVTVLHNGVMLHHHKEVIGTMEHRIVGKYTAHEAEEPLMLQDHDTPVRYRNIWIRRIGKYDKP